MPKRVLIVGAGAVGLVYADALARGGAEVSFFARPASAVRAAGPHRLTSVGLFGARTTREVQPTKVWSDWAEVKGASFDEVWLAVPADALDDALARAVAEATEPVGSLVVVLAPGARTEATLGAHVPSTRRVRGSIQFLSWHAPMVGSSDRRERETPEGWAFLAPPGAGAGFAGPRASEVVATLRRGGLAAHVDAAVDTSLAFDTSLLMPHVLALGVAGWSFARMRAETASVAARASREAFAITARRLGVVVPWLLRLAVRPWITKLVLAVAPSLAPLDLEGFFRAHFRKVHAQTRMLARELVDDGRAVGLPVEALSMLLERDPDA